MLLRQTRVASLRRSALSSASVQHFHGGFNRAPSQAATKQVETLRPVGGVQPLSLRSPVFQIYGANTDVGKTVVSAGLCRSAVNAFDSVEYIKPLQTGTADEAGDAPFIRNHCQSNALNTSTLHTWRTAVSPHLAADKEGHALTDEDLLASLQKKLQEVQGAGLTFVETAGGVLSPSASMRPQADAYRSLRLPVVLVGDGKLGGISTTLSAVESLVLRGYDIAAVCLIEQDGLDNMEAMQSRLEELGVQAFTMDALPPQPEPLDQWFKSHEASFDSVIRSLQDFHSNRLDRLRNMQENAEKVYWWPFTQHKTYGSLSIIDSAHGDDFSIYRPESQQLEPSFDACASWWTQGIGHGNSKLATSIAYAAGRYGHVMFPENAHEPAMQLSQKLVETVGKDWATRVYFSDDGSTAVEVALKIAFRKFLRDQKLQYETFDTNAPKLVVLGQTNCYHGDTLGTMNVGEPSVFNMQQHPWYRAEACFVDPPSVALRDGKYSISVAPELGVPEHLTQQTYDTLEEVFDAARNDPELMTAYRAYISGMIESTEAKSGDGNGVRVGATVLEPVLIGAGGMIMLDPVFQRAVVEESRSRGIPVVFDEVFSGWWRLGVQSGRDLLGVNPDIACYAKLLTGGVVPMAVTLASEEVFESFLDDETLQALLHGHSFTANPIGCAASIASLDAYDLLTDAQGETTTPRHYWDPAILKELSEMDNVERTFGIGTVMAVELKSSDPGYTSKEAKHLIASLRQTQNIYARSLGNVVYFMCSPLTTQQDCQRHLSRLRQELE